MKYKIIIVLFSIIFLSACSFELSDINAHSITGTWQAKHSSGTEILIVLPNREYVSFFLDKNNQVFSNRNIWTIDTVKDGEQFLTFKNFAFGKSDYGNCPYTQTPCNEETYWPTKIEFTISGRLMIQVDPDINYTFIKDTN